MKQLVYTIKVYCDPLTAQPSQILEALKPFGRAEITGSAMKKLEAE